MMFVVNNHQYEVVAQGGDLFVTTEQGQFSMPAFYNESENPDLPRIFHAAMCVVYEGQTVKSFDEFENLFFSGSGDEEGEELAAVVAADRDDYDYSCDAASRWAKVSSVQVGEILTYLEEQYGI